MSISLEQIEALRERAHVSYEEAKEALESCNGDIVEALIYLEKNNKIRAEKVDPKCCGLWEKFKALVRRGNRTKFIIKKKEQVVLSIPVTLAVILVLISHVFAAIGLILALVTGHSFKFEGKAGENIEVNRAFDKVSDFVDDTKEKLSKTESTNQ